MGFSWGGAGSGAMSGASMGAKASPWGALAGGVVGGALGGFMGGGGGGGPAFNFEKPSYYRNEDFQGTQDLLKAQYGDVLGGEFNDYYKPIGEYGGGVFNQLVGDIAGDVRDQTSRSTTEALSKQGITRGGLAGDIISQNVAKSVGDISHQARYQDYERAMSGRGDLFKLGLAGQEGIRGAALQEQGLKNEFELGASRLELDALKVGAGVDTQTAEQVGGISKGLSTLATGTDWGSMFKKKGSLNSAQNTNMMNLFNS